MGNCMCKDLKGDLISKRITSPYSPPAPPPSQEQSQEQSREQSQEKFTQSHDAAPRIATPIPHVSAFDDEIVQVGDVRYIPPDVTHGVRLPTDMDGEFEFWQSLPNPRD